VVGHSKVDSVKESKLPVKYIQNYILCLVWARYCCQPNDDIRRPRRKQQQQTERDGDLIAPQSTENTYFAKHDKKWFYKSPAAPQIIRDTSEQYTYVIRMFCCGSALLSLSHRTIVKKKKH
jgi:hypothetical protein